MMEGMQEQITPEVRRQVAAETGLNEQYLYQCLAGHRDMNPGTARKVERLTKGKVTRQMLCQKTYAEIWPELVKRKASAKA